MKISALTPNERNPRKITEAELDSLSASLDAFGDLGGVVFNRRTNRLVGGHQRITVLPPNSEITLTCKYDVPTRTGTVGEGYITVKGERFSYREVDWAPDWEEAANIAANKHGGQWDDAKLGVVLADLDADLQKLAGFADGLPKETDIEVGEPSLPAEIEDLSQCPNCGHILK